MARADSKRDGALLFDPHRGWTASAVLGAEVTVPLQYARAAGFEFLREKRRRTADAAD